MNWLDKIREQGKDYKRQVGGKAELELDLEERTFVPHLG